MKHDSTRVLIILEKHVTITMLTCIVCHGKCYSKLSLKDSQQQLVISSSTGTWWGECWHSAALPLRNPLAVKAMGSPCVGPMQGRGLALRAMQQSSGVVTVSCNGLWRVV